MDLLQTMVDMSSADFTQRYSNTFVKYDNKPFWLGNVSKRKEKITAAVQNLALSVLEREDQLMELDVSLLDISRPPVQWYIKKYKGNLYPFFLHYSFNRQWKRGVCEGNTSCYMPKKSLTLKSLWPEVVLKKHTFSHPIMTKRNFEAVFQGIPQIVQDSWLWTNQFIFYRSAIIAEVVAKNETELQYKLNTGGLPIDLYNDDIIELVHPECRDRLTFKDKYAHLRLG